MATERSSITSSQSGSFFSRRQSNSSGGNSFKSTRNSQASSYFHSKADVQYSLYCVNLTSSLRGCSAVSVRKLATTDNLFAIEKQNSEHLKFVTDGAEKILED
mmetsp:Transcript_9986/g.15105  ORF Transcript_9986/g.15105 Transcript_9986/m.15105 type:complete len:103 (+) Transcript_9986:672-980(+)